MDDIENVRTLLNDPAGRRFTLEFVVVGSLAIAFVFVVLTPVLTTTFPGVFAAGGDGFGRFDAPETALEWTQALVGTGLLGVYLYGRLLLTELGAELRRLVAEEFV